MEVTIIYAQDFHTSRVLKRSVEDQKKKLCISLQRTNKSISKQITVIIIRNNRVKAKTKKNVNPLNLTRHIPKYSQTFKTHVKQKLQNTVKLSKLLNTYIR